MNDLFIVIFVVIGTILAYIIAKWLYKRVYSPLLLPVAVATLLIIIFLILFHIPYETYMIGGEWINAFLGPAVVALAYPLYQNREILKKLALPILTGTFVGAIIGVVSGVYLGKVIGFEDTLVFSLTPKSVTTPVAMDISNSLGGVAPLAAVFVMIAGISGAMISKYLFSLFRIKHPVGRGVGLGAASHAIGTAKALENGQLEGSISTIAMIVSAIFVSIITPFVVALFM
ncbi:LrgB family protein [Pseudogracilibacillus auburnensis]|uniref:Putative murein hydrolase (TIGR00659 family) n=1 Tax=Pseudogracilibacillus auburnensis TaxID=1494959 RepID=A0A2V3W0W2_9BACI|nr:LrgB family protein [Pseudogracilibacillus auburnensis]MBO1002220.1 LrgB family protein [Pseudogracilibacillus auburnensis]PXW87550.1 putative murein hydrolase (TIGR00659 family) [Pseudogracilibacillus auburnensis]